MLLATLLGSEPIYDTLRNRMLPNCAPERRLEGDPLDLVKGKY